MKRPESYKTKQSEAILSYIISLAGGHVTAAQIVSHFEKEKVLIGRTTIYRHLDRLTVSGKLRRYTTDGISGACYQYTGNNADCCEHLHLKCEGCGALLHLECCAIIDLQQHVLDKHAFKVNAMKTVLYGKCDNCLGKE
ncbi:MAG: transcriptional repressor [Eubacterium sp.]|jgi:Fur family ferric uptake transcriptional regulator|nr:transcriptional repressor [Eubacterium sp.]